MQHNHVDLIYLNLKNHNIKYVLLNKMKTKWWHHKKGALLAIFFYDLCKYCTSSYQYSMLGWGEKKQGLRSYDCLFPF